MTVDFGKTAGDYGRHRTGFPEVLFSRLDGFGVGRAGQILLDLDTGTGSLARGFAARGARVTAIDPAPALLEEARRLSAAEPSASRKPVLLPGSRKKQGSWKAWTCSHQNLRRR